VTCFRFQTYLATYFCIVDCSLLAQYFYYASGRGPATPPEVYVRTRSRTISTARRLSLDASHYRILSTVAENVATAAALAAFSESHPEHRISRKHLADQTLDDTAPQVAEEAQDEVDDAVLSALSESLHSGRKRVSWSQERHDHQPSARSQASPIIPKSLQITAPQCDFAAFSRGRSEQRVADAEEVEVEQPGSRAASGHRTNSRASRLGASMVLLGFGALFSVGALTNAHSRSLAGRSDSIGRVLVDEVNIPHPMTASSVQGTDYHALSSDAGVVTVELPLTLNQNEPQSQPEDSPSTERIIGRIFAWLCTSLYLTSRLPQIWKNVSLLFVMVGIPFSKLLSQYVRKSVEGLSMYLFVFAFLGNFFYVCSILTSSEAQMPPPESTKFFKESIPYDHCLIFFHFLIDALLDTCLEVAAHSSLMSRLYLNPLFTEGSLRVGEAAVHQSLTGLPSLKSKLVCWEGMLFLAHTMVVEVQALYGTPGLGPPLHVPIKHRNCVMLKLLYQHMYCTDHTS
jgi:hypothetical protein